LALSAGSSKELGVQRVLPVAFVVFVLGSPVRGGQTPQGVLVLDVWDVAQVEDGKIGYAHTSVHQLERDGQKILRTLAEWNLDAQRFQKRIQLQIVSGMDETPAGKVLGVSFHQQLGRDRKLTKAGPVANGQLRLILDGKQLLKPIPWDDRVVGLHRQLRLFQEKKVKPGDSFDYLSFEATIDRMVRISVRVKDYEEVDLLGGKKKRLLRTETQMEKIESFEPPPLVLWLDEDLLPARYQVEMPGLGLVTFYRTTRAGATAPGPVAKLTDIGINTFVRLNQRIAKPYAIPTLVYRVTIKGDKNAGTAFARDDRQQVKNVQGQTFELHVRAGRPPQPGEEGKEPPGEEFLQSSYFITSADVKVQEHTRRAIGTEPDPWQKALRIEKWVHEHMHGRSDEALAPADHVARTLEGDCTEYAMLTAAMCRAAGVPARTAVGLIYADVDDGPVFAFHMWTEVWVAGRWIGLDATRGQGRVGATHLKITDQSWHDTRSMTPLLPVLRVLGKVSIEVAG
jgi:hypothetical protein